MEDKPLVLIVDDNPENIQLLGSFLSDEGYNPAGVTGSKKALTFLKKHNPDLILMDVLMPEMNGYELCRTIMGDSENKDLPVIFLTAKTQEEDILEGFESGGVDYITKPFNTMELLARVKTHIELRRVREQLYSLSITDDLTGLYNRRHFKEELEKELQRSGRHDIPFSLAIADIDHFKKVNDTFGHEAGDLVLKAVAGYFKETFRLCDVVGRLGGEEFGILLPETDREGARMVMDRFRQLVEQKSCDLLDHGEPVTISIGITAHSGEASAIDDLLREADIAMYNAKNSGRNQVCLYTP